MPIPAPAKVVTGMRSEKGSAPNASEVPEAAVSAATVAKNAHDEKVARQLLTPIHPHTASAAAVAAGFAMPGQVTDEIVETKVYFSPIPTYMLELWSEPDYFVGGKMMAGKRVMAVWENGLYATSSLREQQIIEAHPQYGLGGAMWDVALVNKEAANKTLAAFREQLRTNPEMMATLQNELSKDDFDLVSALKKRAGAEEQPQP